MIAGCSTISYPNSIEASSGRVHFGVRLDHQEMKSLDSVLATFAFGKLVVSNSSDIDYEIKLTQLHLSLDNQSSRACYYDSVASVIGPFIVKAQGEIVLPVYWVYDGQVDLRTPKNAILVVK